MHHLQNCSLGPLRGYLQTHHEKNYTITFDIVNVFTKKFLGGISL